MRADICRGARCFDRAANFLRPSGVSLHRNAHSLLVPMTQAHGDLVSLPTTLFTIPASSAAGRLPPQISFLRTTLVGDCIFSFHFKFSPATAVLFLEIVQGPFRQRGKLCELSTPTIAVRALVLKPTGSDTILLPSTTLINRFLTMAPAILSPIDVGHLSRRQSTSTDPKYHPGSGSKNPLSFNNDGFLLLFGLIAATMVLASVWFFFYAKNGGFHWKKGDWEECKSTVLRRKGLDGKTLSNATKSTKLGMSEAPKFRSEPAYTDSTAESDAYALREVNSRDWAYANNNHGQREKHVKIRDSDLVEYKQEKSAKVGGLNTAATGSHYDYSSTDPSTASANPKQAKRAQREKERREKQRRKEEAKAAKQAQKNARNYRPDDHATASDTTYTSQPSQLQSDQPSSYHYNTYRPSQTLRAVPEERRSFSASQHQSSSRQHSPQKRQHRASDMISDMGSDIGTKVYPCHIPGLSDKGLGPEDSVSQIGAHQQMNGGSKKSGGGGGYRRAI